MEIVCKNAYNAKQRMIKCKHIQSQSFYFNLRLFFLLLYLPNSSNTKAKYEKSGKRKRKNSVTTYSNVLVFLFRMGKHQKHQYKRTPSAIQPNKRDDKYTNTDRTENRNRFSTQHTLPVEQNTEEKKQNTTEKRRIWKNRKKKINKQRVSKNVVCVSVLCSCIGSNKQKSKPQSETFTIRWNQVVFFSFAVVCKTN